LTRFIEGQLKLQINAAKSAVARPRIRATSWYCTDGSEEIVVATFSQAS
jgi:hypothetical protein